jgi:hypothetical protein
MYNKTRESPARARYLDIAEKCWATDRLHSTIEWQI